MTGSSPSRSCWRRDAAPQGPLRSRRSRPVHRGRALDGLHEVGGPRVPLEEEEIAVPEDNWPEWQKEYRFGVVLILPPEPVLSLVNGLREKHDPLSQSCCDAHISLTVPLPRALTEASLRGLEEGAAGRPPLRIRY